MLPLTAVGVTGSTFSVPSTSSLSSQLTIWGSSTPEPRTSLGVQVEVIQEGGRNKTYAKRLRPTTVISTEKPIKLQRLETSSLPKQSNDINEFDLSFLGNDDELKAKEYGGRSASDSINLSSILSGLTKNLCQTNTNEHGLVAVKSTEALNKALPTSAASTSITQSQDSLTGETTFDKDPSRVSATSTCSSVLTTPIKCAAKTPSKNDNSLDCYKIQPVNFDSQWFGEDVSSIQVGRRFIVAYFYMDFMYPFQHHRHCSKSDSLPYANKNRIYCYPRPPQMENVAIYCLPFYFVS